MLKVQHLFKSVPGIDILSDISFSLPENETAVLLGPSGSGKSSLLRVLAGIEKYDRGTLLWNKNNLHSLKKGAIGMVFQNFQLFPHLSVLDNLCLAPQLAKQEKVTRRAEEILEHFGLDDKKNNYPHQLSGGQKQRIAIARTLMMQPEILLLDEPTSALDPEMVGDVADLLKDIKTSCKLLIVATHELRLAQKIADHVIFLESGKVLEMQEGQNFFKTPKSKRAQSFISKMS